MRRTIEPWYRIGVMRSMLWLLLASIAAAPGCSGPSANVEPYPDYSVADATNDCGPAGGAAISVLLRPEARPLDDVGPRVVVYIWREFGEVSGRSFASDDDPVAGNVSRCDSASNCTDFASWRVTFERAGADSTLTGVLETRAADGTARSGRFRAAWHARFVGCM